MSAERSTGTTDSSLLCTYTDTNTPRVPNRKTQHALHDPLQPRAAMMCQHITCDVCTLGRSEHVTNFRTCNLQPTQSAPISLRKIQIATVLGASLASLRTFNRRLLLNPTASTAHIPAAKAAALADSSALFNEEESIAPAARYCCASFYCLPRPALAPRRKPPRA